MNAPFSYASPTLSVEALKHSIAYKLMFIIGKRSGDRQQTRMAERHPVRRSRPHGRALAAFKPRPAVAGSAAGLLSVDGVFLIGRTLSNALLSLGDL